MGMWYDNEWGYSQRVIDLTAIVAAGNELALEIIIESTGAFNSLEGGSKHLEAGAKKVVLTAPGKECPTYVVGVNEGDYDAENDSVVSNASCTTNGMASVCKLL